MLSKEKRAEVGLQLEQLAKDTLSNWKRSIGLAESGVLSEEMQEMGNYLLAKAIVNCWCQDNPYAPLNKRTKKEFNNLRPFI